MSRTCYPLVAIAVFVSIVYVPGLRAQDDGIDDRVWSRMYTRALIAPELAPPASTDHRTVHGSSIIMLSNLPPQDSPDVEITTLTNTTQSENSVFIHPLNDQILLNSNNSSDFPVTQIFGASYFVSTDGGLTWTGSTQGAGGTNAGDPAAAIGLNGRFYINYIAANLGNGTAYSTNNGVTWTHVQVAPNPGQIADKNHMWVDNSPTSPYVNYLYATWTDFGGPNDSRIVVSRSTDAGLTWSARVNISSAVASGSHDQGVSIQTGPNGEVYAMWAIYDSWPSLETAIGFAKSTNGGATWQPAVRAITNIRGIRSQATGGGLLGGKDMRTASFPSLSVNMQNGHLYVVWTNIGVPGINTGTERDIYMSKSTDGGATWGTAVRVNQDTPNNGRDQWFPWISCDPVTGYLAVIFYDSREFPGNDMAHTYVAISRDGGSTWEDFRVSDVAWSGDGSGTGFSANYAGDYIAVHSKNGKVYPVWTDRRQSGARLSTWISPFFLADPTDPNPPTNLAAYSDFTTPTTMRLSWRNPTTLANGDPIGPFVMRISRNGAQIAERPQTDTTYTDTSLTTYTDYTYRLETRLIANDSLSAPVEVTWTAGGSPFPAAPSNVALATDTARAYLTWRNPTTQRDGTPIHDFGGTIIVRDGVAIDSVGATDTSYIDIPPPGFSYCYTLRAYNTLVPRRYSDHSAAVCGYVGSVPDVLVWQPPDAVSPSGDSLVASLTRLGFSNFKVDDLFFFGPNLAQYDAIFAVIGIYDNNHVIQSSAPEGAALDAYVSAGGKLYMEGGDVFNYDPGVGGYNFRPVFGLNTGGDGGSDYGGGVVGRTLFGGMQFAYTGGNNFMDELKPIGGGAHVLFTVPGSSPPNDTAGVFAFYGSGRSVACVTEFGGLVDDASNRKDSLVARMMRFFTQPLSPPRIQVSPTSLADTLQQGQTSTRTFGITNITLPPAGQLVVNISESVGWLAVSPTADTLNGGETSVISVNFNASGLPIGPVNTNVVITSNDTTTPTVNLPVSLLVTGSPTIATSPDSLVRTLDPAQTAVETLTIRNTGVIPLQWQITDVPGALAEVPRQQQASELYPPRLGRDGMPLAWGKDERAPYAGPSVGRGQGGPDSAGYRWIDSDEPGGPQFNWVDITGVGTLISGWSPTADDGAVVLPLPFSFPFYGGTYSQLRVCTNGWMTLDPGSTSVEYFNEAIPSTVQPNLCLFPFWDDIDLRTSGTAHYYNDAANQRYIVQWTNAPHYQGIGTYTFQCIIKPDGTILYQYLTMTGDVASSTIGIENLSGTVGLQVVYNAPYMHNNLAVLIAKDVPWLSENPESGTVAPGDSAKVAVTFNSTGLTAGTYRAKLSISSNDYTNTPKLVHVRMDVSGAPSILVQSPNGGEQWSVGNTYPITWFRILVDSVRIEYSTNGGSSWILVTAGVPALAPWQANPDPLSTSEPGIGQVENAGTYNWVIPNTISSNCLVRVSDKNNPTISDVSDAPFSIVPFTPGPWVQSGSGMGPIWAMVVHPATDGILYAGSNTQGMYKSTDGGATWSPINNGLTSVAVQALAISRSNPEVLYCGTATGVFRTTSGGVSWTGVNSGITEPTISVQAVAVHPSNPDIAYVAIFDGVTNSTDGLFKTTNGGANWFPISNGVGIVRNFLSIAINPLNPNTVYAGTSFQSTGATTEQARVYKSYDAGATWLDASNGLPPTQGGTTHDPVRVLCIDAVDTNRVLAALFLNEALGGMYLTTDGGANWTRMHDGLPSTTGTLPRSAVIKPGSTSEFFVGLGRTTNADVGVFRTTDGGMSWTDFNGGVMLNTYTVRALAFNFSRTRLYAGAAHPTLAAGQGVMRYQFELVGVEHLFGTIPEDFVLLQNYPNPFNPATRLVFGLPEQSDVVLKVYDILGREIATLVEGSKAAGYVEAVWDGRTTTGTTVGSGVYFYRLQATGASGTTATYLRKMVLMR